MADVRRTVTMLTSYLWFPVVLYIALLPTSTLYNIPLLILALPGMLFVWQDRNILYSDERIKRFGILFLCIWIPMLISLPDAVNFSRSFTKTLSFPLYFLMGVPVILYFTDARQRRLFVVSTGILMLLWCLDAAWQAYSGVDIFGYPHRGQLTGVFYPSLGIGLVLALLSPVFFEFIRCGCRISRLVFLLLVPFGYIIVLAGNKNAWVLLFMSAFLYMLFLYLNKSLARVRDYLFAVLAVLLLSLVVLGNIHKLAGPDNIKIIGERLGSMMALVAGDVDKAGASFAERTEIWEGALRVGRDHWFNGVGPRGFRYSVEQYTAADVRPVWTARAKKSTHPHQYMLEIFVETGVVGLTGYVVFIVLIIQCLVQALGKKHYERIPWLIPMLLVTFPLSSHRAFYGSYMAPMIWMMIAVALSVMGTERESAADP